MLQKQAREFLKLVLNRQSDCSLSPPQSNNKQFFLDQMSLHERAPKHIYASVEQQANTEAFIFPTTTTDASLSSLQSLGLARDENRELVQLVSWIDKFKPEQNKITFQDVDSCLREMLELLYRTVLSEDENCHELNIPIILFALTMKQVLPCYVLLHTYKPTCLYNVPVLYITSLIDIGNALIRYWNLKDPPKPPKTAFSMYFHFNETQDDDELNYIDIPPFLNE